MTDEYDDRARERIAGARREFIGACLAGLAVVVVILAIIGAAFITARSNGVKSRQENLRLYEACADKPDPAYCVWSTRKAMQ